MARTPAHTHTHTHTQRLAQVQKSLDGVSKLCAQTIFPPTGLLLLKNQKDGIRGTQATVPPFEPPGGDIRGNIGNRPTDDLEGGGGGGAGGAVSGAEVSPGGWTHGKHFNMFILYM